MTTAVAIRRPVASRDQNFSFSTVSTSASTSTLTYLLNNTRPNDLHELLLKAVKGPMAFPQDIDNLLHALQKVGIITGAAEAAAVDSTLRHCVRCHKAYVERNNGLHACVVAHDKPRLVKTGAQTANTGPYGFKNHYLCCNVTIDTYASAPLHHHFVGRHTTVADNVQYNASNVTTCEVRKCAGQGATRAVAVGEPLGVTQSLAQPPSRTGSRMEVSE